MFQCNICSKSARTIQKLENHLQMHDQSKDKYHCDICDKEVSERYRLNHINTHNEERKKYNCKICKIII